MWDLCLSVLQVRHQGSELVHVKDVSATSDAVCECDAVLCDAVLCVLCCARRSLRSRPQPHAKSCVCVCRA